jgi:translation initiation factor IF-3
MIRGREVRLVGDKGEQLGVMPLYQAREVAEKAGIDLVEVAPTAVQTKKEREARKGQKVVLLREIRLRPKIGEHDFDAKSRVAHKLLEDGDKVKVTIMFRGRENTHPELGIKLIQKMAQSLADVSTVEREPIREGARLHAILAPLPSAKPAKPKEESKEKTGELENAKA